MLSRQCYLDEIRDSGGCLGVAHIGFHRANGERLARSVASEDRFQRAELDRIFELRPCAVGLDVYTSLGSTPALAIANRMTILLSRSVRNGQTAIL